MTKKLIIYGIGNFAEYVQYVFQNDSEFEVCGFCIEEKFLKTSELYNKPIVSFEGIEHKYPPEEYYMFIAVGNNIIREKNFEAAKRKNYQIASYISNRAAVWDNLKYGENTFIDEGCTVQPFVKIGQNCILFASNIAHHTTIGNHSLVSVCTTGGNVQIGNNCFIGMNSTIKQNIKIADNSILGMGCIIENNTEEGAVFTNKGTLKRSTSYDQIAHRFLK